MPSCQTSLVQPVEVSAGQVARRLAVQRVGQAKVEVQGPLSIKAASQALLVPVQLSQAGAVTMAVGSFTLKLLAFRIGDNEWADTSMVADDVQVRFKLALSGVGRL